MSGAATLAAIAVACFEGRPRLLRPEPGSLVFAIEAAAWQQVAADKVARDGHPTAYVCEEGVCQAPTVDPTQLGTLLRSLAIR